MNPYNSTIGKWTLLLLFLATASCVLAQNHGDYQLTPPMTLHVIYNVTDFETDSIYVGCQKDKRHSIDLFRAIGEAARERGYPIEVQQHPLPWFHKQNTMDYLANLKTDPNDGVILLYSGHGYNKDVNTEEWPLLWYCSENDVETLDFDRCEMSLQDIHDYVRTQMGVRMSLVIGGSCNDDVSGIAAEQVARDLRIRAAETPTSMAQCNNFDLFMEYDGHIMASASRPGQVAYLNDSIGSYYVHAFLTVLSEGLTSDKRVTWPSIFRRTKEVVRHVRKKEQDPQFQVCQGELTMLSDPELHSYGTAIAPEAFSSEWEDALHAEEGIELLPYLLLDEWIRWQPGRSPQEVERVGDEIAAFYRTVGEENGEDPELLEIYLELAAEDLATNSTEEWQEEVGYVREAYAAVDAKTRNRIDSFIRSW